MCYILATGIHVNFIRNWWTFVNRVNVLLCFLLPTCFCSFFCLTKSNEQRVEFEEKSMKKIT